MEFFQISVKLAQDKIQGMILAEKVAKVEFERIRKEKEDERKRLLELRAKKAQEAKNAKKGGKDAEISSWISLG